MPNRDRDWFNQVLRDLDQADDSARSSRHEWACFAAHQAAEKAVKAFHLHLGQEASGHVVARLLDELPKTVALSVELTEQGRVLDNFYIPISTTEQSRYGAPYEHYGPLQSGEAIRYACEIIAFVHPQMA